MLSEAFSHEFIVIRSIHHLSTQHSLLDIFNFDGVYKEQSQKCYAISFSCLLHRRAHTSTSHDVIIHRLFITQWAKRERGIGNQEYKRRRENTEEKKIDWTTISRLYMKYKNGVWFNCEVRSRCAFSLKKNGKRRRKKESRKIGGARALSCFFSSASRHCLLAVFHQITAQCYLIHIQIYDDDNDNDNFLCKWSASGR